MGLTDERRFSIRTGAQLVTNMGLEMTAVRGHNTTARQRRVLYFVSERAHVASLPEELGVGSIG